MMEMKPRERFVTALSCGTPDRVPLYDGATQVMLGLDGVFVPAGGFCGFEEEPHAGGARYLDEWGITYVKNGWPVMVQIDAPIKRRSDWKNYRLPDPRAKHRAETIREAVRANEGKIAVIAGFLGLFTMMYW